MTCSSTTLSENTLGLCNIYANSYKHMLWKAVALFSSCKVVIIKLQLKVFGVEDAL